MEKPKVVRVRSARVSGGYHEGPINITAEYYPQLQGVTIMGLSTASAKATTSRILDALHAACITLPGGGYRIGLTPQHIGSRDATSFYDLPIALGMIAASGAVQLSGLGTMTITGNLRGDGTVVADKHGCPFATLADAVSALRRRPSQRPAASGGEDSCGMGNLFGGM